ncbi:MAG: AMP-binding protein [Nevskiales bacterium]
MANAEFKSPLEMMAQWESQTPNKVYLRQPVAGAWREYTWAQFGDQVRRVATALKSMNFPKGSRIAISGRNTAHWFMADLAIAMAGHVSVGLYPKQASDAVTFILKHSDAKAVFIGPSDDVVAFRKVIPAGVKQITFPYPDIVAGDYAWNDLVAEHEPQKDLPRFDPEAMFTIVYTSGTTGNPKGVVLTGNNLKVAVQGILEVLQPKDTDRLFSYLPLAHIFERGVVEMFSVYGNTQVSFLEDLRKFPIQLPMVSPTLFVAVPAVWTRLQLGILEKMPQKKLDRLLSIPIISGIIKKKILAKLGLQNVRFAVSGAAPISESVLRWWDKMGVTVHQGYAMSENTAYAFINQPGKNKFGSVGQLLPRSEAKIAEDGEILTRSGATMPGYYLEPEKTAEVIEKDGWLHTGDKGYLDDEGFLFITGRVKEIFKTVKGKYVAPAPIEGKFGMNSDIESLCLVGAGLSQPVLLVSLSPGGRNKPKDKVAAGLKATLESVNATLEAHECIDHIGIVKETWTIDNNMLTPTLKVKRNQVEKQYQPLVERAVSGKDEIVWE